MGAHSETLLGFDQAQHTQPPALERARVDTRGTLADWWWMDNGRYIAGVMARMLPDGDLQIKFPAGRIAADTCTDYYRMYRPMPDNAQLKPWGHMGICGLLAGSLQGTSMRAMPQHQLQAQTRSYASLSS